MAVYVFDDHYREKNPGKADFLLLDGWELPEGESRRTRSQAAEDDPSSRGRRGGHALRGQPVRDDSGNLDDLDAQRAASTGCALPDLARYLLLQPDEDASTYL